MSNTITQLNPPIPLMTPKGRAMAHFIIDYGMENDLMWVCFQDDTGGAAAADFGRGRDGGDGDGGHRVTHEPWRDRPSAAGDTAAGNVGGE